MNDDQLRRVLKKLSLEVVENIKGEYDDHKNAYTKASDQVATLKSTVIHFGAMINEISSS